MTAAAQIFRDAARAMCGDEPYITRALPDDRIVWGLWDRFTEGMWHQISVEETVVGLLLLAEVIETAGPRD